MHQVVGEKTKKTKKNKNQAVINQCSSPSTVLPSNFALHVKIQKKMNQSSSPFDTPTSTIDLCL